jgi:hypothetical protein
MEEDLELKGYWFRMFDSMDIPQSIDHQSVGARGRLVLGPVLRFGVSQHETDPMATMSIFPKCDVALMESVHPH